MGIVSGAPLAPKRAQEVDRPVVVRVLAVHFVDKYHAGLTVLLGLVPLELRAYLHSLIGGDENDGGVADPHPGHDFADEVQVAGGVEEGYLGVAPLQGEQGEVDADVMLLFVGVVVGDRRAFVDTDPGGRRRLRRRAPRLRAKSFRPRHVR